MPTILLLTASNLFMTVAWYWHLKGGMTKPLWSVVLISWAIALFEYCLAVPANRLGYAGGWSAGQLKITQEVISLILFGGFMVFVLGEPLGWRHLGRLSAWRGRSRSCSGGGEAAALQPGLAGIGADGLAVSSAGA